MTLDTLPLPGNRPDLADPARVRPDLGADVGLGSAREVDRVEDVADLHLLAVVEDVPSKVEDAERLHSLLNAPAPRLPLVSAARARPFVANRKAHFDRRIVTAPE